MAGTTNDFEVFYGTYVIRLRCLAVRLVGETEADDVVQEVMLRAARHIERGGFTGCPWSWLVAVSRNLAVDRQRQWARVVPTDDSDLLDRPTSDTTEEAAVRGEARRRLSEALRRLTPDDRAAFVLREVDGDSIVSIAATLGVTPNTLRQRLFRARHTLARHFQDAGGPSLGTAPAIARERILRNRLRGGHSHSLRRVIARWQPRTPGLDNRFVAATAAIVSTTSIVLCVSAPPSRPPITYEATAPRHGAGLGFDAQRAAIATTVRDAGHIVRSVMPSQGAPVAGTLTWTRRTTPTTPPARHLTSMVYDERRHETILFGGQQGATALGDTWTFDGTSWTEHHPATAPSARYGAMATYDAGHGEVVLFGGYVPGLGAVGDTWIWDGATWRQQHPSTAPLPCARGSLAYDEARRQVILFSGRVTSTISPTETWSWDGATWHHLTTTAPPTQRYGGSLAYDAAHRNLVLFGSSADDGNASNRWAIGDTWTWDGTWHLFTGDAFPAEPRADVALAFDRSAGSLLTFGGSNRSDTWSWTGTGWLPVRTGAGPANRSGSSMVYDTKRERLTLFGGMDARGLALGDTWTGVFRRLSDHAVAAASPDVALPVVTSSVADLAVLGADDVINGEVADDRSGVRDLIITYALGSSELSLKTYVVGAHLTCDANARSCTWTATVPADGGIYAVTAFAQDRSGNLVRTQLVKIVRLGLPPLPTLPTTYDTYSASSAAETAPSST